ncbi:MAG: hypothetical protein Q7J65_00955 [Candidatus Marinimicrobia bacterium]|nr:hypothetical protein [Candidatus Neomarinimicrobiota bacterium]
MILKTHHDIHIDNTIIEICNECGKSVRFGTGLYVNRVVDLNDIVTKIEMGKPFPSGGYICINCDNKLHKECLRK